MPFWLYMRKESVGAAENLPPELEMHGGIVEIPSEDLHVVSRYIAKWAWQYDKGALLKKCMLNWQKKNEVSLPYNAFSYLSAEAQAHTKEAAKYVYLDLLNILCGKNTMNMYGYVHFGALNLKRYYQSMTNRLLRALKQKEEEAVFVQALQLLVKAGQPAQKRKARVFLYPDGAFAVYDEKGHDLKEEYLSQISKDEWQSSKCEDQLLSVLVNYIPSEIIVQKEAQDWSLELLSAVFGDSLKIMK